MKNVLVLSLLAGCVEITPYTKNEDYVSLKEVVLSWDYPVNRFGASSGGGIPALYPNAQKKVYVNNPFRFAVNVHVDCGYEFHVSVPAQSSSPIYLNADNSWPWKTSCYIRSAKK